MRGTAARGATTAAILPAAFLVALLVGAPFAGTTTAPLIADRAATSAPQAAAPGAAPLAAPASRGASGAAGTETGDTAVSRSPVPVAAAAAPVLASGGVPIGSIFVLIVAWLVLALVGFGVLYVVAANVDRRERQAPGSASGSSRA